MPNYVEIPILPVARRCGIELDPKTVDRVEVEGYCPFCNARHNHLHLNTDSNKWHCKRCGLGGNAVTLYGKVHNLNNRAAFDELMQDTVLRFYQKPQRPSGTPVHNLASLERRHDVYYDLLKLLPLSAAHKASNCNRKSAENPSNHKNKKIRYCPKIAFNQMGSVYR